MSFGFVQLQLAFVVHADADRGQRFEFSDAEKSRRDDVRQIAIDSQGLVSAEQNSRRQVLRIKVRWPCRALSRSELYAATNSFTPLTSELVVVLTLTVTGLSEPSLIVTLMPSTTFSKLFVPS